MRREDPLDGMTRRDVVGRGATLFAGATAWLATIRSRVAAQGKMSKEQASYQESPQGDQRCGNCAQFIAEENACRVVEGAISPQAWCRLWTQAS